MNKRDRQKKRKYGIGAWECLNVSEKEKAEIVNVWPEIGLTPNSFACIRGLQK
jgi:hypothetical protein